MLRVLLFAAAATAATLPAQQRDYVVLSAVAEDDAFDAAAQHLAAHHDALLVRFDPADLGPVAEALTAAAPRHVALVMRPEQLDFAFQRRFLELSAKVDDDPFVDFAFGYVTGANGDEALALAKRGTARAPKPGAFEFGAVAGGVPKSQQHDIPERLGGEVVPSLRIYSAGDKAFPEEGRDREFLAEQLPKLTGRDVVTFIGHGYPHEVHGGPDHRDIADLDLTDAVALNVACYTGTTDRWFKSDYRKRRIDEQHVPADESFCLHVLRSGVVGYTAYLCPRPAGPELDTDRTALVFDGASLGDARRRDYDKTVLGFLGFGEDGLALRTVDDGAKIPADIDAVRDMMLEGATGGVLFGDPACVPFAGMPEKSPVQVETEPRDASLRVRITTAANVLFTHCNDPTARWEGTMAMKAYARVPLGDRLVRDVEVQSLHVGGEVAPTRLIWAVEEDHGERFLQVKVNFPRSKDRRGDLACVLRVETTADAAAAKSRGGEVDLPPRRGQVHAALPKNDVFTRAEQREIPREVVEAAIEASKATLTGGARAERALEKLAGFGAKGFEATICLLESGNSHYRSWQLVRATWRPGDERRLMALASGPPLPSHATWTVLRSLGVADTPEVRAYLKQRLATESNAGLWMSTAQAVALLGAREFADEIGARILEFRNGWSGVESHLVAALADLGGPEAIAELEKVAAHPDCASWKMAMNRLERLDAAAAERAAAARRGR